MPVSSTTLRLELSQRNTTRVSESGHELSYGKIPSVIYREDGSKHGNFLPASYRSICANPEWQKRLKKRYSGSRWVPWSGERTRCELDCANSSDALLMNIFCYPRVLNRPQLCTLLGIGPGLRPIFGFKPRIPLLNGQGDQTEVDMKISDLLAEAKLTESGFQLRPSRLLHRYRDLGRVHTNRRASTMRANCRKARKTRSSFSKREKMRRKPLSLRKSRSISLRFL